MILGFLVSLAAVFPTADLFRRTTTAVVDINDVNPVLSLTTGDFRPFAQLNNTLLCPAASRASPRANRASGVAPLCVHRDIWPGRPVETGILLANSGYGAYPSGVLSWSITRLHSSTGREGAYEWRPQLCIKVGSTEVYKQPPER